MMEDLRNFCSKVDVDAIRAKIPPMPQIKLPKSVSKIKSRKIFRITREDFSSISRRATSKRTAAAKSENIALPPLGVYYPPIPPSEFIDRTPTRISTISSLMNQKSNSRCGKNTKMWQPQNNDDDDENSYRNAGGIDDYYPSPMGQRYGQRMSQPISPLKAPNVSQKFKTRSQQNVKMSFGEKLQKGYKDLSEFKLKHLFAKRTIVHADKIEVNSYIPCFEEDRKRDEKLQRKIDRNIADNYRFQFKVSQQKSEESFLDYDSPDSSPENVETTKTHKNLSEQSGDESGMESSPPNRTPGIAATRFSRVRQPPINMSLENETYNDENIQPPNKKQKSPENVDIQQNSRKSTQQTLPLNRSREEVTEFDDIDNDDNLEIEDVESPKIKPIKNTNTRQSPKRKSAKGIAATITSKDRNAPINRTQDEDLDISDGDIELDEIEIAEVHKMKTDNTSHSQQNYRRKSAKGTAATITPKDRNAPINRTQEEDLDVSDGDIELNETEIPESHKIKPDNRSQLRQIPRRKSAKGIAATITSKDRNAPINRTQEEDLDVTDGDIDLSETEEVDSPKIKQIKKTIENDYSSRQVLRKSLKGTVASSAFSKDRHGHFNQTQEENLDDSDVELEEFEDVESTIIKQSTKSISPDIVTHSRQIPRRKSAKGIVASSEFSKNRNAPINKTQEEDLDTDNDNVEMNEMVEPESPKIKQRESKTSDANRSPQNNMPLPEESYNDSDDDMDDNFELNVVEEENSPKIKPNSSSLYDIKKHKTIEKTPMTKSIKERMTRLTKQKLEGDETNIEASEKKRPGASSPEPYMDNDGTRKSDKPFDTIKTNLKRIHKSIKVSQNTATQSGTVSDNEDANFENKRKLSKTHQFSEHLKRFRSTDTIDKTSEEGEHTRSPRHNITHKLQGWKNSIKKKVDSHSVDYEDDYGATSPQKQGKPVGSLIKKLKHIRSRRRDSNDDPDDDEEGGETYKESLASRAKLQLEKGAVAASQMPQKTMKKISETKKFFKKKQDENDEKKKTNINITNTDDEELDEEDVKMQISPKAAAKGVPSRPPMPVSRPQFMNPSSEEDLDDVDNHKFITKSIAESQLIAVPAARTVWTTKPILSDDTTDYEEDLPRVVLHQDNSNVFEPTLIIAVTRPISCTTSPIITELPPDSAEESTPDTKPDNWIPNQDMVATFLDMTPPSQQKNSKDVNSRAHSRKQSIDTSSDDSWIKDIPKGPSVVPKDLNENQEPWKYQNVNADDTLYKTKSIDLFEMQKQQGGVSCAFEDFDEELRNTPVVKVEKQMSPVDETETDDNEEFKDFDDEFQTEPLVKVDSENATSIDMEQEVIPAEEMETEEFKDFEDEVKTTVVTENDNLVTMEKDITPIENVDNNKNDSVENVCNSKAEEKPTPNLNIIVTETPLPKVENDVNVVDEVEKNEEQNILEVHRNVDEYQRESSEELENPDDETSSRITKIAVNCQESKGNETTNLNSICLDGKGNGTVEIDKESHIEEELDRPPSTTPSPPPIPQRKPSLKQSSLEHDCPFLPPPPLAFAKPPLPPNKPIPAPPKIPDRNSTPTVAKPLVKTASLRLAYNEQVNPKDIGKVNKLISRFETEAPSRRPSIIPRKPYITNESEESSENEDLIELLPKKHTTMNKNQKVQKSISVDSADSVDKNVDEVLPNDIPKKNNNYKPIDKTDIQRKYSESVNVVDIHEKDISNNCHKKSTTIDIPVIPAKSTSVNSTEVAVKKPTAIVNKDNKYTPIDIPEIQHKPMSFINSEDIQKNQKKSISIDSTDIVDKKDKNSESIDIQEIQQKSSSINSVDVPDKNDNSKPTDSVEAQDKNKNNTPVDIPINKGEKSTPNDILEIQQKYSSLNSVDIIDKNENNLEKNEPKDIPKKNVMKSSPIDISEDQAKPISTDTVNIQDKDDKTDEPLETKQNSISKVSVDIPDKSASDNITNNIEDQTKMIEIADVKPKSTSKTDLSQSTLNNDNTTIDNNENKSILIIKPEIKDKSSTPIDISNHNKPVDISTSTDKIENKSTTIVKPVVNVNDKSSTPIDISNHDKPTSIEITTINNNNTTVSNVIPVMTQKSLSSDADGILHIVNKPTSIDISNHNNIESTLADISNKCDNKLTSVDMPDSNANTPISVQKTLSSNLVGKTTLELLEDNSVIIETIPNISISSSSVDVNSNFSQPTSVYGSPLDSPLESAEVTPIAVRKDTEFLDTKRNRRNVDNENCGSFDSDEENSYYSISSTGSNRYVVDL